MKLGIGIVSKSYITSTIVGSSCFVVLGAGYLYMNKTSSLVNINDSKEIITKKSIDNIYTAILELIKSYIKT
jgi:hypothetical protein